MIVVAQCLRHRIADGAAAIDQLRSSSRIARASASRLRVNEGERCLGDFDARFGRYVGISHDDQPELERRYFRVRGSGGECCISECRFLVWRTALTSAAPFAWFRSSWHCYFRFFHEPVASHERYTPSSRVADHSRTSPSTISV